MKKKTKKETETKKPCDYNLVSAFPKGIHLSMPFLGPATTHLAKTHQKCLLSLKDFLRTHVDLFDSAANSPQERVWESLPLIIAALISVLGGAMALLLPETMGRPMPQTLADGERLANTRLQLCG